MAPLDITSNVITAGAARTARGEVLGFALLEFAAVAGHFDGKLVPTALAFDPYLSCTGY